jgi:hypothetical protein
VFSGESGKVLVWVGVVLFELLDDVLTDIGVVLLDLLRTIVSTAFTTNDLHSELVLWGDLSSLSTVPQELLDKAGDVSSSNRDVLDRGSNNVSLGLYYQHRSYPVKGDIQRESCLIISFDLVAGMKAYE